MYIQQGFALFGLFMQFHALEPLQSTRTRRTCFGGRNMLPSCYAAKHFISTRFYAGHHTTLNMTVTKMLAASAVGAVMLSSGAVAAGGRALTGALPALQSTGLLYHNMETVLIPCAPPPRVFPPTTTLPYKPCSGHQMPWSHLQP